MKETTTQDAVTLFFRNKRRSRGGELCPGKDGYQRLSVTAARLTFQFSKDAHNVLERANEIPFKLEGNVLKVDTVLKPIYHGDLNDVNIPRAVDGEYPVERIVMEYINSAHQIEIIRFRFKSWKYDSMNSTFYFTKDLDDLRQAEVFKTNVKAFLNSFCKKEIKIPEGIFREVGDAIQNELYKFKHVWVDFIGFRIHIVGKKENVTLRKQTIEEMIETEVNCPANRMKIASFKPLNATIFRFFLEHSWDKITEKNRSCNVQFIDVSDNVIKLTGTSSAREEMISFLEELFKTVVYKVFSVRGTGMKELIDTKRESLVISTIEKTHKCIIEKCIQLQILEKPDGSLKFSLGSRNLRVEIACADICNETTDIIMHVATRNFAFGGVGAAVLKSGGPSIFHEYVELGQKAPSFTTLYTNAGNLAVREIAHVFTNSWRKEDLKQCLEAFFDDVSRRNVTSISFSAIGTGVPVCTESESACVIFDSLSEVAESKHSALRLVRIVILDQNIFSKFKGATKAYFWLQRDSSGTSVPKHASSLNLQSRKTPSLLSNLFPSKKRPKENEMIIKIYSDDFANIEKAYKALRKTLNPVTDIQKKKIK